MAENNFANALERRYLFVLINCQGLVRVEPGIPSIYTILNICPKNTRGFLVSKLL